MNRTDLMRIIKGAKSIAHLRDDIDIDEEQVIQLVLDCLLEAAQEFV